MKRRKLGQHYLIDPQVVGRMVSLAEIGPADRVLEVGTGRGALTRELVGLGATFEGYEIDRENYAKTLEAAPGAEGRVHLADAFEQSPEFDVLVSSLPYSESSSFVLWLCGARFRRAVVLLQEDFARKVTTRPGARDYRGVSALAQVAFDARIAARVNRDSVRPQPRGNSVIVVLSPRRRVSGAEASKILRLFSLRRRRVEPALAKLGMKWRPGEGQRRVNSLTPDEVHEICGPEAAA